MLQPHHKLALYMEGALGELTGKMGSGCLRYSPNEIVAVIDSRHAGRDARDISDSPRQCPIVGTLFEAVALGADVLVLGIAPPGGLIPEEWYPVLDEAVAAGLSLVNGLHDRLSPRYPVLAKGQFVWDIRVEPQGLDIAHGDAKDLPNRRVLMIGTDMSCGKMTAGLELWKLARERGIDVRFVATGQIGITVTGAGVPLDAVRVDYAGGAIEREVLRHADAELIIVEGQGSLIHPASSANLPLLRGTMPTHLVLCHRAGAETLRRVPWVKIPPLSQLARLYEELGSALGTFPRPKTAAVCLNTAGLSEEEALACLRATEAETGLPATDPVRHGVERVLKAVCD